MSDGFHKMRIRAGWISLIAACLILALKLLGFWLTGSVAILSDALESIVNVVAAAFLLFTVRLAAAPPDPNHPYGHGKVEYFAAAVEGGLILAASVSVIFSAIGALIRGAAPHDLGQGLVLVVTATVINLFLGLYLLRSGKRLDSIALVSDGTHVLTDVITSVAVVIGVGLVLLTGYAPLDPITALLAGANIGWTGLRLFRQAIAGLMNEADLQTLQRISAVLAGSESPAVIHVHHLRAWTAGAEINADFHLTVPNYLTITQGHDLGHQLEQEIGRDFPGKTDVIVHLDPCKPETHCIYCRMDACPLRTAPFAAKARQDLAGMIGGPI